MDGPPNVRKRCPVFPPARPVQYCALTSWCVVLPSCLDSFVKVSVAVVAGADDLVPLPCFECC